jgi:2-C-methyl-D-erythritol 4-phosphate cytidylyltransferase
MTWSGWTSTAGCRTRALRDGPGPDPAGVPERPLLAAYQAAASDGFTGTDTASCVERYEGLPVQVVAGDPRNIKVTYADDLFTAELILTTSGYQL